MAIKLGSIYGIPLYLDYSWFIILALIVFTVGFAVMPSAYPGLTNITYFALGLLSALLLFVSIVVHELAHSILAKRNGLKIGRITLYLLGGVSEMSEEPPSAGLELRMAAAGPLTSLAIAGLAYGAWLVFSKFSALPIVLGPLYYTAFFNLIIAGFNLLPAFPMDGGRVLRSLVWRTNGDMIRSTKIASNVGRIFAYILMFGGVLVSFLDTALLFDGIWFVLIGWFISSSAQSEYRQVLIMREVAGLKARDMMTRSVDAVSEDLTLTELSSRFLQLKHNGFPVMRGEELVGSVTMHDLHAIKKELWDATRVSNIMTPRDKLVTVKEYDSAREVMAVISAKQIGRVIVLSNGDSITSGHLAGIITRNDVMRTIHMQESFQRSAPPPAPAGSERWISVEVGMLFQIVPTEKSAAWSVTFNQNEFSLISEQMIQIAPGKETKQFTMQALKKGTFYIFLSQPSNSKKNLRYTIIVS